MGGEFLGQVTGAHGARVRLAIVSLHRNLRPAPLDNQVSATGRYLRRMKTHQFSDRSGHRAILLEQERLHLRRDSHRGI